MTEVSDRMSGAAANGSFRMADRNCTRIFDNLATAVFSLGEAQLRLLLSSAFS